MKITWTLLQGEHVGADEDGRIRARVYDRDHWMLGSGWGYAVFAESGEGEGHGFTKEPVEAAKQCAERMLASHEALHAQRAAARQGEAREADQGPA